MIAEHWVRAWPFHQIAWECLPPLLPGHKPFPRYFCSHLRIFTHGSHLLPNAVHPANFAADDCSILSNLDDERRWTKHVLLNNLNAWMAFFPSNLIWVPVQIRYMWPVRFWGGPIPFQGFVEISVSIPKLVRKWIKALFCLFQVLRQHFMFPSFWRCLCFLSCSSHSPLICMHFPSFSFHIPPMCIRVLQSSFHLHGVSLHFVFMSFHFLSVMKTVLWLGHRTECNKRLSLNYP